MPTDGVTNTTNLKANVFNFTMRRLQTGKLKLTPVESELVRNDIMQSCSHYTFIGTGFKTSRLTQQHNCGRDVNVCL